MQICVSVEIKNKPAKDEYGELSGLEGWNHTYSFQATSPTYTQQKVADFINAGGAISTVFTGGSNCKLQYPHKCNIETAKYKNRLHRCSANFIEGWFIGLDHDRLTTDADILEHPFVKEHAGIIYRTASYTPQKPRYRSLYFLETPLRSAATYSDAVLALMYHCGIDAGLDLGCIDATRIWYGSENCEPIVTGKILPIDELLELIRNYKKHQKDLPGVVGGKKVAAVAAGMPVKGLIVNKAAALTTNLSEDFLKDWMNDEFYFRDELQQKRMQNYVEAIVISAFESVEDSLENFDRNVSFFYAAKDIIKVQDCINLELCKEYLCSLALAKGLPEREVVSTWNKAYKKVGNNTRDIEQIIADLDAKIVNSAFAQNLYNQLGITPKDEGSK